MNALVIYAHPNPMSFNAAVVKVVQEELEKKGAMVKVKDLYAMNWNPVLSGEDFQGLHTGKVPADIKQEQADVSWADKVVMVAPVWWHSVPAMLKGYIDRVFSIGFAYEYTQTGARGLLGGKKGLVITTSGADEKTAQQTGMLRDLENGLVNAVFGFSGFSEFKLKNLYAIPTVSDDQRKQMLTDVRTTIANWA
ncbi:MAG: NAD(P)H-dependent oxidoreductase [Syntrophomonas sp.]